MSKASYFSTWVSVPMKTKKIFKRETTLAKNRLPLRRKRRYALFLENLPLFFKYRGQINSRNTRAHRSNFFRSASLIGSWISIVCFFCGTIRHSKPFATAETLRSLPVSAEARFPETFSQLPHARAAEKLSTFRIFAPATMP